MTMRIGSTPGALGAAPAAANDDAALRKVATDLQGVFAEQLFKAMRETVPKGEGAFDGGGGEEMFTSLMDQQLAADTSTQWGRGLADAIVRQLRRAHDAQGADGAASPLPTPPALPLDAPPAALPLPLLDAPR